MVYLTDHPKLGMHLEEKEVPERNCDKCSEQEYCNRQMDLCIFQWLTELEQKRNENLEILMQHCNP